MPMRAFLVALQESGRVVVARPPESPELEIAGAGEVLLEWDAAARSEAAGTPPPFSAPCALWGAQRLYRAAQAFAFRDLGVEFIRGELERPLPQPVTPGAIWSVDLTLRFLPDLLTLARGLAPDDPLVVTLEQLARDWPLASIGVRGLGPIAPGLLWGDPSLRAAYVDRVLERRDGSRLSAPEVLEAARVAVGEHRELCPELAGSLDTGVPVESPA